MIDSFRTFLVSVMSEGGLSAVAAGRLSQLTAVLVVFLTALLLAGICRRYLVPVVLRVVARTSTRWDDYFINRPVLLALCQLLPALLLYALLPFCVDNHDALLFTLVFRLVQAYIALSILLLVSAFLKNLTVVAVEMLAEHHLVGILQFMRLLTFTLGGIVIVSLLLGYNPTRVVAGLGAVATVLMLIFKDSLLGLVSGIQLSVLKMLKVGDWVTLPKHNINGKVEEISLTTVKVRNFDNTISTVPPYLLVSDSFQNWDGMFSKGLRRVKRSLFIDVQSITFADSAMRERLLRRKMINKTDAETEDVTNLTLYRHHVAQYLKQHTEVAGDVWILVRQLEPTPTGLPIELWFYLHETEFVRFEELASTVMEQVIARIPEFGLRLYQSPTGNDLRQWHTGETGRIVR